jgi:hypothetical protein
MKTGVIFSNYFSFCEVPKVFYKKDRFKCHPLQILYWKIKTPTLKLLCLYITNKEREFSLENIILFWYVSLLGRNRNTLLSDVHVIHVWSHHRIVSPPPTTAGHNHHQKAAKRRVLFTST